MCVSTSELIRRAEAPHRDADRDFVSAAGRRRRGRRRRPTSIARRRGSASAQPRVSRRVRRGRRVPDRRADSAQSSGSAANSAATARASIAVHGRGPPPLARATTDMDASVEARGEFRGVPRPGRDRRPARVRERVQAAAQHEHHPRARPASTTGCAARPRTSTAGSTASTRPSARSTTAPAGTSGWSLSAPSTRGAGFPDRPARRDRRHACRRTTTTTPSSGS